VVEQPITDALRPGLREWFEFNVGTGRDVADVEAGLVAAGYRAQDVQAFVREESARFARYQAGEAFDADPVGCPAEAAERFWRRLDVLAPFNRVLLVDRVVPILVKYLGRGIFLLPDFLSDEECDGLIAQAEGRMEDSKIFDQSNGALVVDPTRSSRSCAIRRGDGELVRRIESRIAKLTDMPVGFGENLQIVQYAPGGEYIPHFDYFDPETPGGAEELAGNSQRLLTVIMYLSDVEGGGWTQFPDLNVEFTPMKGAALLFPALDPQGSLFRPSLHWGRPVFSGEKWIATKWIRLTPQA
jgi:prolyl 4-hydroxylase